MASEKRLTMVPYFLNSLELIPDDDGGMWTVADELVYHSMACTIVVPKGFRTDLGSTPRFIWNILPPQTAPRPFVLHDYLYTKKLYDRLACDKFLLEAMIATGVEPWKIQVIYRAVRMFGGSHY
jgi:hypothetical protein